jgi:hypothetical protein
VNAVNADLRVLRLKRVEISDFRSFSNFLLSLLRTPNGRLRGAVGKPDKTLPSPHRRKGDSFAQKRVRGGQPPIVPDVAPANPGAKPNAALADGDLAEILWASGLQVTAGWCIATETESATRVGNYVQGTVLLVLRRRFGNETGFIARLQRPVENAVYAKLQTMRALDDGEDPNFGDTDYQLAAYAAARSAHPIFRYR